MEDGNGQKEAQEGCTIVWQAWKIRTDRESGNVKRLHSFIRYYRPATSKQFSLVVSVCVCVQFVSDPNQIRPIDGAQIVRKYLE